MSREYNLLTCKLPDCVTLFGKKYPVHTSFKNWIEISILAEENGMASPKTLAKMLKLCYCDELPPNVVSASLGMLAFLNGDTDFFVSSDKKHQKLYSFSQDTDAIYSAFYGKYGIDLCESDMHWYKFCALFSGLADENPFKTLIKIRTADEADIKSPKAKLRLKSLKAKYRLTTKNEINVAENISSLF